MVLEKLAGITDALDEIDDKARGGPIEAASWNALVGAVQVLVDIVVVAVGRPGIVPGEWIKPGAVVIDVGMNRDDAGKLCGDVDFAAVKDVASWITPVPGGVGPMTINTLIMQSVESAEKSLG